MILTDREIKARHEELIESNYDEERVGCVSYDLMIAENGFVKYRKPIWVPCFEIIRVPLDMTAYIIPRNIALRSGLRIEASQYFPGYRSRVYLRIENLEKKVFYFEEGMCLAQIIFEQLTGVPEKPYNGKYQNEVGFNECETRVVF